MRSDLTCNKLRMKKIILIIIGLVVQKKNFVCITGKNLLALNVFKALNFLSCFKHRISGQNP